MLLSKCKFWTLRISNSPNIKSSRPGLFLGKRCPKICSKCAGEHPYRSAMSIKLQSKFIEIALRSGCSPVHLLHIFWTPFPKNTSGRLLLKYRVCLSFLIFQLILQRMFFSGVVYPHWPLVLKLKKILKSFSNIIHLFDRYQKNFNKIWNSSTIFT